MVPTTKKLGMFIKKGYFTHTQNPHKKEDLFLNHFLGLSIDGFQFTLPKSQGNLQELLIPSSELIKEAEVETKGFASKDIFKLLQEMLVKTAIDNYIKKLTINFISESYFLYDKSNFIKETFMMEINKIVSIYGSVSYFDKKGQNKIFQIISSKNSLEFSVQKDTIKSRFGFQLTNINGNLPKINNGKIYDFSLTEIGNKRKTMTEPIQSVIVGGQQKFDFHDILNSVEIEINDDRILNILKKHKNIYCKLTHIGLLFPSSITNDTKQILVTCRELNDAKKC